MTEEKSEAEYSLQNAMNILAEIHKILFSDSMQIYMKKASEVDADLLKKLSLSFGTCSLLFDKLTDQWINCKSKGPDAIQKSDKLEDRIDVKVYLKGKPDFDQMKKITFRLNRIDDALALYDIGETSSYLKNYANLCSDKGLDKYAELSKSFSIYFVEKFQNFLITESKRLGNQIERCNLYYQAKLNTTTLKIAHVALAISALSVALTIIGLLILK